MSCPVFISEAALIALHDDLLEQHGGLNGIDTAKLGSVAAYSEQKFAYATPTPSIPELGACYAIAANRFHAFSDGNKRVAAASMELFLLQNGFELMAPDEELQQMILDLAADAIGEPDFIAWVISNTVPM